MKYHFTRKCSSEIFSAESEEELIFATIVYYPRGYYRARVGKKAKEFKRLKDAKNWAQDLVGEKFL